MYKSLQRKEKGFTIIEVLIVLAIAGLIMLIVFLAVPALQRNQRNTSRRNDVARILGGAQEVINNDNGQLSGLDSTALRQAVGDLGYYDITSATAVTVNTTPPPSGTPANASTPDTVIVYTGAECDGGLVLESTSSRKLAAAFSVESGNGDVPQCTES